MSFDSNSLERVTRRRFLQATGVSAVAAGASSSAQHLIRADDERHSKLLREVGVTTSSMSGHLRNNPAKGQFNLLELPKIMRDELDMRVIDLNTTSLGSVDKTWLDRVRKSVDDAGCVLTNLKMNQRGVNMGSTDGELRKHSLTVYKKSIDAAAALGIPWARPLPVKDRPDMPTLVDSYRELFDYGADRNVRILVENYAWMESDPLSVVNLIKQIDRDVATSPDTGNWKDDSVRFPGLTATFPLAVTCDFKARKLGPNGEHELYDLERCFRVGWNSGFRGPWCLEHANADRKILFRELALLRDRLKGWMS